MWAKNPVVLEVDTGVDLSHKQIRQHVNILEWVKEDYIDRNGHGTHIAGIILKDTCPEVELISCKYYDDVTLGHNLDNTIKCFKQALNQHIDIINYSSTGTTNSQEEFDVLTQLSNRGTQIVVSMGNDGIDISKEGNDKYPAKYDIENIVPVGNLTQDGHRNSSSNYGLSREVWMVGTEIYSTLPYNQFGYMTGTSQATAAYTNKLLKDLCKKKDLE